MRSSLISPSRSAQGSNGRRHAPGRDHDERIVIVAPVGQDAVAMATLLNDDGFKTRTCRTTKGCSREISVGAGAVLLTEEALELRHLSLLIDVLKAQPSWSELPIIILTSGGESRLIRLLDMVAVAAGTVTLLERPLATGTLLRSVEVALRSRRRQYQVRDLVTELAAVNRTLEQRVAERTAQAVERAEKLRLLSTELVHAEESERRRISQVLHDDLQQLLMAARIHFKVLCETKLGAKWDALAKDLSNILAEAFETTRSLSLELAPPVLHESGLAAGLRWLAAQTQKRFGVTITITADESANPKPAEVRIFLFRAVRELLLNAVKHAGGSAVQVAIRQAAPGRVGVTVADNGPGFDPAAPRLREAGSASLGLFNMREGITALGGEFYIDSAPGRGTCVEITVPCTFAATPSVPPSAA